jgi:hypothetical protein
VCLPFKKRRKSGLEKKCHAFFDFREVHQNLEEEKKCHAFLRLIPRSFDQILIPLLMADDRQHPAPCMMDYQDHLKPAPCFYQPGVRVQRWVR